MSLSINTNNSALVALESLNATQAQLSSAENTVSTGQKISNAADNPAIYAIASSMNGNLQGLSAVSDSLSLGAQVVSTANTAAKFITSTLATLQNTVTAAGQTGIDASAMASQVLSAIDTINSYARNATFSGVNLLTSGSDAVNAYNGTSLNTLANLQGSTIQFATAVGNDTTLADKLGLTTASAAGSSATVSAQSIFSSLNASNVTDVNTSGLTASSITLGTGSTAGTTVTVGNKTFEFVQSGDQVSSGSNIAVSLDSGFSTSTALSGLVAAMNGSGVAAAVNSDGSLAIAGAAYTTDASKITAITPDAAAGNSTATLKVGGTTYQFVTDASYATAGNKAVVVGASDSVALKLTALAAASNGAISYNASANTLSTGSALTLTSVGTGITSTAVSTSNISMSNPSVQTFNVGTLTAGDSTTSATATGSPSFITVGSTTYEFTTAATTGSALQDGNTAISVASSATTKDMLQALATTLGTGYSTDGISLIHTGALSPTVKTGTVTSGANGAATVATSTPFTVTAFKTSAGTAQDQLAVGFKGGVATAVSALQAAITNMSSVSQTVGNYSNQITGLQTYTSNISDALTTGVGALTNADMAAASAKLTSLQTKQQLAIKSLTIANSQSQQILSLFQ